MKGTRRVALWSIAGSALLAREQFPSDQQPRRPQFPNDRDAPDEKLPNGKSQKDAIAKENHKKALDEAEELIKLCRQLQDELEKAGDYVVPMNSVRRTEDIEKLAKRIRSRLKA